MAINMKNVKFTCDKDMSKYKDSMLFESETTIAEMTCEYGKHKISVELAVKGDIRVFVGEESRPYTNPMDFPPELRKMIEEHPNDWNHRNDVYVESNNWFEYLYTDNNDGDIYSDGEVAEENLSRYTEEDVKNEMLKIAKSLVKDINLSHSMSDNEVVMIRKDSLLEFINNNIERTSRRVPFTEEFVERELIDVEKLKDWLDSL